MIRTALGTEKADGGTAVSFPASERHRRFRSERAARNEPRARAGPGIIIIITGGMPVTVRQAPTGSFGPGRLQQHDSEAEA